MRKPAKKSPIAVLRRAREPEAWTQQDLADATGLSLSCIACIERRQRRGEPGGSVDSLQTIANAFGVELANVIPQQVSEGRR